MLARSAPDRRCFLTTGLAALAAAAIAAPATASAPSIPPGGALRFKVYRKGALLGEHRMTFTQDDSDMQVRCEVDFVLGLGPLTLLRYRHRALETWTSGRFQRLETSSTANGKAQAVSAHRVEGGVMIQPAGGPAYLAGAAVLPLTHWNRQAMRAPLFNPQDGKLLRERATDRGADTVSLADGRSLPATRYSLTGETQIDDWYDDQGVWAALRGRVKDGSVLDYRRVDA